jgi:mono/diheme cytochrome c family protein
MKIRPVYIIAGILLVTAVFWTGISAGNEGNQGKMLFDNKCAICHGNKGDGSGRAAAFLGTRPADFTDRKFWENHNDKQIADIIENGKGQMPAFDLTPEELKSVLAYITQVFKPLNK